MCFMVNKGFLDMLYEITRNNDTIKIFHYLFFWNKHFL